MAYLIFKLIHIFAVIFFLGNIVIDVFWKNHGDRSGDPKIIAHTIKGIIRADRFFTMPAVAFLILAGFGAMGIGYLPFETGWIMWGFIMIIISAAAFMAKVVPAQKKLLKIAETDPFDQQLYDAVSKEWNLWGSIATIAPLIAVILMVLKIPS
ncbi:MAG TPA: DUF2269 family protein [Ignavibacteriaceae bacterium]|jgi:uncharacterized membrane protein|nr:DUF2269 family protein [Ignavibacteriaceae bacterium]